MSKAFSRSVCARRSPGGCERLPPRWISSTRQFFSLAKPRARLCCPDLPSDSTMLGRRQELNLQFLQIVDAFLIVLAFWGAHTFRYHGVLVGDFRQAHRCRSRISSGCSLSSFHLARSAWKRRGFTSIRRASLRKKPHATRPRRGRAGMLIAACSYFLRLNVESRAVMPMFAGAAGHPLARRANGSPCPVTAAA